MGWLYWNDFKSYTALNDVTLFIIFRKLLTLFHFRFTILPSAKTRKSNRTGSYSEQGKVQTLRQNPMNEHL